MKPQKRNKIKLATELWRTIPAGTGNRDFTEAFKKKHGVGISMPAAHYAKSLAGLVKKRKKVASDTPSMEDLKTAKAIAAEHGGVDKLLSQIAAVETVAGSVGGIDALKQLLTVLKELTA